MKHIICTFLVLLVAISGYSQDRHFTLFDYAPLTINAAQAGAFLGTVRVGGIYRSQQPTLNQGIYSTPNIYIDAPIIKGFRKYDWVGVGLNFWSDRAGSVARLTQNKFNLAASYHFALDKKRDNVFSIGLTGGTRSTSLENLNFNETESVRLGTQSSFSAGVGLLFRSKVDKKTFFEIGLSADNIGGAAITNLENFEFTQPLIMSFQGRLDYKISDVMTVSPKVFVQTLSGGGTELALQGWLSRGLVSKAEISEAKKRRRTLKPSKTIKGGIGYRLGNAVQIMGGITIKNLELLASYDITLSDQRLLDNSVGGFEIAARYILSVYKEPSVKPVLFCPKF